jgi:hypothetical protein
MAIRVATCSRDQEPIAAFDKQVTFAGISIVTIRGADQRAARRAKGHEERVVSQTQLRQFGGGDRVKVAELCDFPDRRQNCGAKIMLPIYRCAADLLDALRFAVVS